MIPYQNNQFNEIQNVGLKMSYVIMIDIPIPTKFSLYFCNICQISVNFFSLNTCIAFTFERKDPILNKIGIRENKLIEIGIFFFISFIWDLALLLHVINPFNSGKHESMGVSSFVTFSLDS